MSRTDSSGMKARKPGQAKAKKASPPNLTAELAKLLDKTLLPDLRTRARDPGVDAALRRRYDHERAQHRTADGYPDWLDHTIEQVGAAWILSCVFVRTLEDRGLVPQRRIAGANEHSNATDSEQLFFELYPSLSARDYLLTVLRELSRLPGGRDVFGPEHNPAWHVSPSNDGARALLDFFREVGRAADADGELRHRFAGSSTRFLGDLYQDLSAGVRERYALLQTPDFVERFILDQTLEPAIVEFGLEAVRLIDPTCGSGHFLLGAFGRLFEHHQRRSPGLDAKALALAALAQVHGADINPYAVAIARFRLTLAFLEAAGIVSLAQAPELPLNLVVADSLLHGHRGEGAVGAQTLLSSQTDDVTAWGDELFALDDGKTAERILLARYHAVVGNPPYITCKDAELREMYRQRYESAAGKYALAAPFTERFFQLATSGGFVGLINANSFMKREFGKKLIEVVLPRYELTEVVDTSGALIPGHGTPTVLLFGRNRMSMAPTVRAVMGKRGEPGVPEDPAKGVVWSGIAGHHGEVGYEDEFVSVAEVQRETLSKHPWSLGGGGAAELKEELEQAAPIRLATLAKTVGVMVVTGEDDLYTGLSAMAGIESEHIRSFGTGEDLRDWGAIDGTCLYPYSQRAQFDFSPAIQKYLWPMRAQLRAAIYFGKTKEERGYHWAEYAIVVKDKWEPVTSIAYAEVATHNHFVLDRGGKVFKQTAPVIKLPVSATEDDHLALLGYLNSSTADFYLHQVAHNKGIRGEGGGITAEAWEQFNQRNAGSVGSLPVPETVALVPIARALDQLAQRRATVTARRALEPDTSGFSLVDRLSFDRDHEATILARMVSLQEELDWLVYEQFGLLTPDDLADLRRVHGESFPNFPRHIDDTTDGVRRQGLHPGHRPFEIHLAARVLERGEHTAWFARNNYRSPSEIRDTYAPAYVRLLEARLRVIERNPRIALIEKPEYKRRWTLRDWDKETREAVEQWFLDRAEAQLKTTDRPARVRTLVSDLLRDPQACEVLTLIERDEGRHAAVLESILMREAVPFLAVHRYTDDGMVKRAAWEEAWSLQRREDAGEQVTIEVPPKYGPKDFRGNDYFRHRGKLDVAKERFVSYPGAERDDDKSPLIGWAGWHHLQRMMALAALYQERKTQDGWAPDRLAPLLAGLLELLPWVNQWHNEPNAEFDGQRLGEYFEGFIETEVLALGLSVGGVREWRPEARGAKMRRDRSEGRRTSDKIDDGKDGIQQ